MPERPQDHLPPGYFLPRGDVASFTEVYNAYYARLWAYTRRLVGNPEVAADIISETFIKLWRSENGFATRQHVEAFLHVAARNAGLNYLKQTSRQQEIRDALEAEKLEDPAEDPMPYDLISELMELIRLEVKKLPEKYHKVFEMAFIEGLKNDEIATLLRLSNQTVRTYKKELLGKLRLVFEDKNLLWTLLLILKP